MANAKTVSASTKQCHYWTFYKGGNVGSIWEKSLNTFEINYLELWLVAQIKPENSFQMDYYMVWKELSKLFYFSKHNYLGPGAVA